MEVGDYIRESVIPQGMSVTEAAKRLDVGRPTLSRLLNGHASLSQKMALRLERAFDADRQKLLTLQDEAHRERSREEARGVTVSPYPPPFLTETLTDRRISEWAAGNISARDQLPVLLRRLINSTGQELRHVDFPGGDNAQRPGWDGWVEADAPTQWIPEGKSGWELSTEQRPSRKANDVYATRVRNVTKADRAVCTFVFVSTCKWPGKTDWAMSMAARRQWKDVRAFDASDLEQWLEASITGQMWMAERLDIPTEGFETLEQVWARWAEASKPRITAKIFEPSITAHRGGVSNRYRFNEWLAKPTDRPFTVAADSKEEALAFLACLFRDSSVPALYRDQAAVFESAQTLRKLASSRLPFIVIARSEEVQRELDTVYQRRPCIVVRLRNESHQEPYIAVEPLAREAFEAALGDMGIEREAFDRWARESGRSPTVLRRRLSKFDAIRKPQWAKDKQTARRLIPIVMVGTWNTESEADRKILSELSGGCYSKIEETITDLLGIEDCPVWSAGKHCGVVSKIDAVFAISQFLTRQTLEDFFAHAKTVLSEADPSLDLPEDQQWAAAIYDKVRKHSTTLRSGICETLVLLSVHGNALFQNRLGLDMDSSVSSLIRDLLEPLTVDKILSHESDLPNYAEAAPAEFLRVLEIDLQQQNPELLGMLKPADSGIFSNCPRTGLLWALECIAWNPRYLSRVSKILAKLSKTEINDNWVNRPINSLWAIYRSWFPQTAASLDLRIKGLEMLVSQFPDIGWQICMQQFGNDLQIGMASYQPRWRADASSSGRVISRPKQCKFDEKALELAISMDVDKYDGKKLGDLIERLDVISRNDRDIVWQLVDTWAEEKANESAKDNLRKRIRRFALTRIGRKLASDIRGRARDTYIELEPRDVIIRHQWLFADGRMDIPDDETEDERLDFSKREKRIDKLRAEAMEEIWVERGMEGILSLLEVSDAAHVVGRYAALRITNLDTAVSVLQACLSADSDLDQKVDNFMQAFIPHIDVSLQPELLLTITEGTTDDQKVRILCCAPCDDRTWRILDQQSQDIRDRYWQEVNPYWIDYTEPGTNHLIDRLLAARRPRAAFRLVEWRWRLKKVETSRLKQLLLALATTSTEPYDTPAPDSSAISEAMDALGARASVTTDEMAWLEFAFINALERSAHGIPNLERQIEERPILFVQVLALRYKRSDEGQDPTNWRIEDSDQRHAIVAAAYRLLRILSRIPGTESDSTINTEKLRRWVTEVRRLCAEHGRADMGDFHIGQLLAKAPSDEENLWPCRPVCEVMEIVQSESLAHGFQLGVYNSRGMHMRGEGGDQERELAAKYRNRAQRLDFEYPYVSSVLEGIARGYDADARQEDSAADVRRRLVL